MHRDSRDTGATRFLSAEEKRLRLMHQLQLARRGFWGSPKSESSWSRWHQKLGNLVVFDNTHQQKGSLLTCAGSENSIFVSTQLPWACSMVLIFTRQRSRCSLYVVHRTVGRHYDLANNLSAGHGGSWYFGTIAHPAGTVRILRTTNVWYALHTPYGKCLDCFQNT